MLPPCFFKHVCFRVFGACLARDGSIFVILLQTLAWADANLPDMPKPLLHILNWGLLHEFLKSFPVSYCSLQVASSNRSPLLLGATEADFPTEWIGRIGRSMPLYQEFPVGTELPYHWYHKAIP